jgi:hypothetical protein
MITAIHDCEAICAPTLRVTMNTALSNRARILTTGFRRIFTYVVTATGHSDRVFEIVFEGDPLLNDNIRREAANEWSGFSLRRLEKDHQGVWHCTQDIKLRR